MNESTKDLARQERLNQVYRHLFAHFGVDSQKKFAEALHVQRTALSAAMNGNKAYLTNNLFTKICASFPNVFDYDYLVTGKGSLLLNQEESTAESHPQPQQPTPGTIDQSSLINVALSTQMEEIAHLKQIIQDMKEQHLRELAGKDEIIAKSDKIAEERLHRIAELRRIIDANNFGLDHLPFPPGVADYGSTKSTKK